MKCARRFLPRLRGRGTAEGGGGGGRLLDTIQNMLQIVVAQDVGGSDSHHSDLSGGEPAVTAFIVFRLLLVRVRHSIDLNREPSGRTIEIENVGTDRMLSAKS